MTRVVQFRRGPTSALATILGAPGEIFVDTSLVTIVVQDGINTGGTTLARATDVNTLSANTITNLYAPHVFNTTQTFSGSNTSIGSRFYAAFENITLSNAAAYGIINYDVLNQSILLFAYPASSSWTLNFRGSSIAPLNNIMNVGDSVKVTFMAQQGPVAFYNTSVTVDGTANYVSWLNGTIPTQGNTSSIDTYVYTIIKTASSAYTVLAAQTTYR